MYEQFPLRNERKAKERVIQLVHQTKREAKLSGPANYQGINDPVARC